MKLLLMDWWYKESIDSGGDRYSDSNDSGGGKRIDCGDMMIGMINMVMMIRW